jgi:SAM-dependent methyltransferase
MTSIHGRTLRQTIAALPVIGPMVKKIYRKFSSRVPELQFKSTAQYWSDRYAVGGNSGAGSYGRLAKFKADVINDFVAKHAIKTVVEFGCGDGAQLELARYPQYTGIDISSQAVALCRKRYHLDPNKQFFHASSREAETTKADLAMSLDVIYHLVEDDIFERYMSRLVLASYKFMCIYSSNDDRPGHVPHVRHRRFTDWLAVRAPQWKQSLQISNPYPEDPDSPTDTSWANFYFFTLVTVE